MSEYDRLFVLIIAGFIFQTACFMLLGNALDKILTILREKKQ